MPLGGAERQMSYLAIGLKKSNHNVRLVTFFDLMNGYQNDLDKYNIAVEIHAQGKNPIKRAYIIRKIVNNFKPDKVIAYKYGTTVAACVAQLLGKSFNLIVSERNTTQRLTRKERLKFYLYRFATHIVPNSYSQAEFIEKYYPDLYPKITVITNMIDLNKFNAKQNRSYEPIATVLTTARISSQKNILNYLKAINILKQRKIKAKFLWYGYISSTKYMKQVNELVEEFNLNDYIKFYDGVTDAQRLYQSADIFCLPSNFEGFPNVLCEAMASQLPTVASNICDNPLILRDSQYMFEPSEPIEIANVLENMIKMDRKQRSELGLRNRDIIVNLCNEKNFIDSYLNLC